MTKTSLLLLLCTILWLISCKKENLRSSIDPELAPFIQSFIEEGAKRGVVLSTERLESQLVDMLTATNKDNICGYGDPGTGTSASPSIEIKNTDDCWIDMSDLEKENLMFHELGHALLARPHINDKLPNGASPKSIMCGDGACSNFATLPANGLLRDYYLDELFNINAPFDLERNIYVNTPYGEDFEDYEGDWEEFILNDGDNLNKYMITLDTSGANALAISSGIERVENASIVVLKRFDLLNFNTCNNLVAKANIRTEGLTNGYFEMSLSLRERLGNGELRRFELIEKRQSTFNDLNSNFKDFELELYCLPDNVDVVTIAIVFSSKTPATLFLEDVVVDLYE